jgi:HK97 gp10 family phage protein
MADVEIVEDNTDEFGSELERAIARGLEKVGLVAEGYAKRLCPVDTGRLRNSITHTVGGDEMAAYIGTDVEYGPHVEFGTSRSKARPFLRPAAHDHATQYRGILESELRGR